MHNFEDHSRFQATTKLLMTSRFFFNRMQRRVFAVGFLPSDTLSLKSIYTVYIYIFVFAYNYLQIVIKIAIRPVVFETFKVVT